MRLPFSLPVLLASVFAALFTAVPAHADTYSITSVENDNHAFYGMDDLGNVVFTFQNAGQCTPSSLDCYYTYLDGSFVGVTSDAPALDYDYSKGPCYSYTAPVCSATDNGRTVTAYASPNPIDDDLYLTSGSKPPQLITTVDGITGYLAINGSGDVVFDSGTDGEWYEAVDLSVAQTPEPATLLLLATGALACGLLVFRRRGTALV